MDLQPAIDHIVAAGLEDERVTAVLLFGSHVAGRADDFSDLDIGIVTRDDALEPVVARLRDLARAAGTLLFVEYFSTPAHLHVIYAGGVAIELIVTRASDLSIDGPHRVLFDNCGRLRRSPSGLGVIEWSPACGPIFDVGGSLCCGASVPQGRR